MTYLEELLEDGTTLIVAEIEKELLWYNRYIIL